MNVGKTVFAQLMEFIPWTSFGRIVTRYGGDVRCVTLPSTEHFRIMAFAQLTWRESLRDIEHCFSANAKRLYSMGLSHPVRRSTLADANERRDWRIWADLAGVLIKRARKLYVLDHLGIELDSTVYALDATTIDLCLGLFDWAPFRTHKAAIRLNTLLDLRGNIPAFINITDGKTHEVNVLDTLPFEAGCFYIMDRGYFDFERLYRLHCAGAFFVIRAKSNLNARRVYSHPVDKQTGLICDQTICLNRRSVSKAYPQQLRRIKFKDPNTHKTLVFLTNNHNIAAASVATLYKSRWQIELFFKWIKQHLRIKHFLGYSQNAVKTQIWCAIATYVLIAIVKKELDLKHSLYTLLQIFSVSLFERIPILSALQHDPYKLQVAHPDNQLILFDF